MHSLDAYLAGLTEGQRTKLRVDSIDALRLAWPHRDTKRGRWVVDANVTMLRRLRG